MWKLCANAQFPHCFEIIARNSLERVRSYMCSVNSNETLVIWKIRTHSVEKQKQPLNMTYRKTSSWKICKFHRKSRKHLWWSLFLIKLQSFRPAILLKGDSNTGVFLWNLPIFSEYLFFTVRLRWLILEKQ